MKKSMSALLKPSTPSSCLKPSGITDTLISVPNWTCSRPMSRLYCCMVQRHGSTQRRKTETDQHHYQREKVDMDWPSTPKRSIKHHETSPGLEPRMSKKEGKTWAHLETDSRIWAQANSSVMEWAKAQGERQNKVENSSEDLCSEVGEEG